MEAIQIWFHVWLRVLPSQFNFWNPRWSSSAVPMKLCSFFRANIGLDNEPLVIVSLMSPRRSRRSKHWLQKRSFLTRTLEIETKLRFSRTLPAPVRWVMFIDIKPKDSTPEDGRQVTTKVFFGGYCVTIFVRQWSSLQNQAEGNELE